MKKVLLFCFISNTAFAASDTLKIVNNAALQGSYTSGNYNNYSIGLRTETKISHKGSFFDITTIEKLTEINDLIIDRNIYGGGLTISNNVISGIPTESGNYAFKVQITDNQQDTSTDLRTHRNRES